MRQIPDVSANAGVATGWATYTAGSLGQTGGTSAAAPFWAASTALIDEYARHRGVQHLGFVDPMLYAIASSPQPNSPFHDITVGSNRYYPATAGWDFATGLGSPNVYGLAQDIVRYLQQHPARG
jgi:kumamolisin